MNDSPTRPDGVAPTAPRAPQAPRATGARALARAEIMRRIVRTGRAHLAEHGAAALSLRAVARDLGMVSSAVYRYVASRDELLTLLIVESYDALGLAVERAEAAVPRGDGLGRWLAACRAARRWAIRHPQEYALIYGSPVPGYAAPRDTVEPAARVARVLITVIVQCGGPTPPPLPGHELPEPVSRSLAPLRAAIGVPLDDETLAAALIAWTHLFGAISFELFGHRHGVLAEPAAAREAFFIEEMTRSAATVGLGLA